MAAGAAPEPGSTNPCCAELKKEYAKLKDARNALRQAVKILQLQEQKLQAENTDLKKRYDEECKHTELEIEAKRKECNIRHELEKELSDLKAQISSYQEIAGSRSFSKDEINLLEARAIEGEAEMKRLRELLEKEKMKRKSEEKKATREKEKAAEAKELLAIEKSKTEENRRLAETEKNKANGYRLSLEKMKSEVQEFREKLTVEKLKADDIIKKVEIEKQKTLREKMRADSERMKTEEQIKLVELQRKIAEDEKVHVDCLSKQLEEEKQKTEGLQKKIEDTVPAHKGRKCSLMSVPYSESDNVKLLREQLKLEKKRVKYAKRVARLEKSEKSFICQQINHLKQDFVQLSFRLNMLDGCHSHRTEGKEGMTKIVEVGSRPGNCNSQSELEPVKSYFNDLPNFTDSTKEFPGLHLSGTRPISGISSELESPIRDYVRNKSQCSAVCSTNSTFSDRTFMGSRSQGRDDLLNTRSNKLTASSSNRRSSIQKMTVDNGKTRQEENSVVIVGRYVQRNNESAYLKSSIDGGMEIAESVSICGTKRKRTDKTLKSIARLLSEKKQLHLKLDEDLSVLLDVMGKKDGLTTAVTSHCCEFSKDLETGTDLPAADNDDLCRGHYEHDKCSDEQRQRHLGTRPICQDHNQQQTGISESGCIRKPYLFSEKAVPNMQMQDDNNIFMEQSINAFGTDQDALICSANMNCEDCMKLLDLDNDDDERRYRAAMEAPLSPTLPEVSSPRVHLYGEDECHCSAEELLRISEAVKDDSMSFHTVDVIDLETETNKVKPKTCNNKELLSNTNRDFIHSSEELKCSDLPTSPSGFNHSYKVQIEHNPRFRNNSFVVVEQMHDATETNDLVTNADASLSIMNPKTHCLQAKSPVGRLFNPNTVQGSYLCDDSESGKTEKNLPPGDGARTFVNSSAHSKPLHKEKCSQSHNSDPDHGLHDSNAAELMEGGNASIAAVQASQASIYLVRESNTITVASKQPPLPATGNLEYLCRGGDEIGKTPKYCVVFSNTKDRESISRITRARDSLMYQNFMALADSAITEVLYSLKLKPDLLPVEKVSAFFSLLLYGFSGTISSNSNNFTSGDILRYSEAFAAKIKAVLSDEKTVWLFEDGCSLDILFNLIEDFLIGRKILIYGDGQSDRSPPLVSSCSYDTLEGRNCFFSYKAATIDQLEAGGIILACICAAVNDIGFLLEVSYKILRMCRSDTSWVLLALHIFASITGQNLFTLNKYSFLIDAIRSVVSLLERGHDESFISHCNESASDVGPCFPPCEQCPFYEKAISVDKFTSLLLDVLQDFSSGVGCYSSAGIDRTCVERDEESTGHKYDSDGPSVCDSSCMLFMYINSTHQSNNVPEQSFCHYADIISLVELVGCYMSWEWISNNLIPRLLLILESCVSEEFSAALFVLIGQLARFGVDAGGYQQNGFTTLRSSLSIFLDPFIIGKRSFSTQFAIVGALLNLLPITFGEIVDRHAEYAVIPSQSDDVELIQKWFSQLSRELQSFSLSLFKSTDDYKV